jgi:hypothetical protein
VYRPEPDGLREVGEQVSLAIPLAHLHAFDATTGNRIPL